ncbi:MAG: orotidine-5'-phosphate decarboxylase, partial [Planctomycetes bacterium]|nr:orotidine-5'-phosphate decarboxylase [Planctomycetota bacterium]
VYARLPADIAEQDELNDETNVESSLDALLEYCRQVIEIVAPMVPAVKINSAFFERYYSDGVEGYYDLVQEAAERNLIVIGDVKRGDVGHSSLLYAQAHLADPDFADLGKMVAPDAVTVNPYFGLDALRPFLDISREQDKGLFALVQTSNESAAEVQGLTLDGGMKLCEKIGVLVNTWAGDDGLIGDAGYSCLGAVVSPRDEASTAKLRALMPNCIFLVPGFGTQGRTADQVKLCFKPDGTGALVTASRSVIYAYEDLKYLEMYTSEWGKCVEHACRDFVAAVKAIVPT